MSELKSAWEVAQERVNKLGKLSAEEKEQQERQQYRQIGRALAQKWLDSPHQLDVTAELNRYEEKERALIKETIIARLLEAIELRPIKRIDEVKKIIRVISGLRPELQPKAEGIGQLFQEYEEAEQNIRQELEGNYRAALHQLRISGTAVDVINVEASPQWQSAQQGLIEAFAPRLDDLKQALVS